MKCEICLLTSVQTWAQVLSDLGEQLLGKEPLELSHFLRQTADLRPETDVLCRILGVPGVLQRRGVIISTGRTLILLPKSTTSLLPGPRSLTLCMTVPHHRLVVPHLDVWPHCGYRWPGIRGRRHLPSWAFEAELVWEAPQTLGWVLSVNPPTLVDL